MALKKEGDEMPETERVAYLKGKVEGHDGAMSEIRTDVREIRSEIRDLRADMNRQFHALDGKINWVIGCVLALTLAMLRSLLHG